MPGGLGLLGQTYKLSKEGTPMNFTVLSASYAVDTYNVDANRSQNVDAGHKLLVIHYSIENPNTEDLYVSTWQLFQAVDTKDTTTDDSGEARRAQDKTSLSMTLKPGQAIDDIVTYIVIPADSFIPKLILKYAPVGTDYKVIRYMMGTKNNMIKPLPAPFADPSDKSGSLALPQISATVGTTYTTGLCDMSVDSISLAPGPFGTTAADDGKQFLVAKITATNKAWAKFYFNGNYKIALKTEDDKLTDYVILKASSDVAFDGPDLESGDTTTHRILVQVPKGAKLKTLSVAYDMGNDGISRQFIYDVSGVM